MQRGERGENPGVVKKGPFSGTKGGAGRTDGMEFEFHVWWFFFLLNLCDGHIHGYPSIMKGGRGVFILLFFLYFFPNFTLPHITRDTVDTGQKRIWSDGTVLSRSLGLI